MIRLLSGSVSVCEALPPQSMQSLLQCMSTVRIGILTVQVCGCQGNLQGLACFLCRRSIGRT